jgi:ComF family protein
MPAGSIHLGIAVLNFFFPPVCFSCSALLENQGDLLCPSCRSRMVCVAADDPLFVLAHSRLCGDGLCADLVCSYRFEKEGPVQALVHALKYSGGTVVGRALGREIGDRIRARPWACELDVIVPLPLHRARERERGYNQAGLCARGIGSMLGLPVLRSGVRRTRWTRSQTTLGFAERQDNVASAFVVPLRARPSLRGKHILLVDDVITTGATIRACAAALASCAPGAVYAASIAVAEQVP